MKPEPTAEDYEAAESFKRNASANLNASSSRLEKSIADVSYIRCFSAPIQRAADKELEDAKQWHIECYRIHKSLEKLVAGRLTWSQVDGKLTFTAQSNVWLKAEFPPSVALDPNGFKVFYGGF